MKVDVGGEPSIESMLKRWGEWQRSPCGSGRGGSALVGSYDEWRDNGSGLMINRDPQSEYLDRLVFKLGCVMGIEYRHAIEARYVREYSLPGVADYLGCSVATVKVRLQSAEWWLSGVMFGIRIQVIA